MSSFPHSIILPSKCSWGFSMQKTHNPHHTDTAGSSTGWIPGKHFGGCPKEYPPIWLLHQLPVVRVVILQSLRILNMATFSKEQGHIGNCTPLAQEEDLVQQLGRGQSCMGYLRTSTVSQGMGYSMAVVSNTKCLTCG